MAKGRARHIPPQTDTVVRFAPEHVVLFLCFHDVDRMEGHKTATRIYALQEKIYSTLLCA